MGRFEKVVMYLAVVVLVLSYPWLAFFLIIPYLCNKE